MQKQVLVIDSSKENTVYNVVSRFSEYPNLDAEISFDRALAKISRRKYDLVVVAQGSGKVTPYDFVDELRLSEMNKRATVIIVCDNATMRIRLERALRGRRVKSFTTVELEQLGRTLGGELL